MNMFEKAIKNAIISYFDSIGISYDTSDTSFDKIFEQYMNTIDKWIPPQPRKVLISKELLAKINAFTDEQKQIVNYFKGLFESGKDINGHLSRLIYNSDKYDKLLMLWDIRHIHLNIIEAHTNNEMRLNRSDNLLFVRVTEDTVYFIDIEKHDKAHVFSMFSLLKIVQNNWEFLLTKHSDIIKTDFEITNDEMLEKCFNANINCFIYKINESYYSVGAKAQTLAGTSLDNALKYGELQKCLNKIYPKPPIYPKDVECILHHKKDYFCDLTWMEGSAQKSFSIRSK